MLTAATLFSGIGAAELATPHWTWLWHAEIEKFQSAVLEARFPGVVNLGDVSGKGFTTRARHAGRPDVIIFGSPCQSFSIAGRRLGMDDPRGNLTLTALAIIAELKPRWFVIENVPDFLSSWSGGTYSQDDGRREWETIERSDFAAFLGTVDGIGYSLAWGVLDAQWFKLAQRRERLIAVGYLGEGYGPAAVLFEPKSLCGDNPPCRGSGERVAPTIEARANAGGAGWGTDFMSGDGLAEHVAGAVSAKWAKGTGGPAGDECYNLVAAPLNAGMGKRRGGGAHADPMVVEPMAFDTTQITNPDNRSQPELGVPCHPLTGQGHPPAIAFKPSHYTRDKDGAPSEIVPALSKEADKGDQEPVVLVEVANAIAGHHSYNAPAGNSGGVVNAVIHPAAVRRLTPLECERLQGFPDNHTLIKYRGKLAADSPRYKAIGNAMPVPVMRWVQQRIEFVDGILEAESKATLNRKRA